MRNCRRCGHRFTYEAGFASVNFSEGATALEQLRNGRLLFLCEDCAGELRAWLGISPFTPIPKD